MRIYNDNDEHCARVLKTVVRLSNLHELFVQLPQDVVGEEPVAFLENLARGCPHLEVLMIGSPTELPAEIIPKITMYPNLKELTLYSPNVWDECLFQLLKCPSLKSLGIYRENIQDAVAAKFDHLMLPGYR